MRDAQKSLTFYAGLLFFSFALTQDPWYKPKGYFSPQLRTWNAQLESSERHVLDDFTPEAQEILQQSPLRHHWLGPNKVLKNEIPAGEYCKDTEARRIDRKTLSESYLDDTVFHESVHGLPFSCDEFDKIYTGMKEAEWPIKRQVEAHLKEKYDPKFADLTFERIAYVAQFWRQGKEIPSEMKQFLSQYIAIEKIRTDLAMRQK